jgi:hypothetical protein
MPPYSLAVAAFDFLPVAVAAGALAMLARGVASWQPALAPVAWAGALLVPAGGLCKAGWKLLVALGEPPIAWLENLLFIAMAPGFTALALALHHALRAPAAPGLALPRARLLAWCLGPLVVAAGLALAAPGRAWFFFLIAVTTLANGAMVVQAMRCSRALRAGWAAPTAFAASFVTTLLLAGLSRLPQGEATAWTQESVNLVAQAALAFGAWRLSRRMRESVG